MPSSQQAACRNQVGPGDCLFGMHPGDFVVSPVNLACRCRGSDNDVFNRTDTHEQPCEVTSSPASATVVPSTPHWPMRTAASRAELEELLADDVPYGDLTTDALGIGAVSGSMQFTARDTMVLALAEDAAAIIELAGCRVDLFASSGTCSSRCADPDRARPGVGVAASWKVAQTLIEIWSGVATDARAIVAAATLSRPTSWWPAPARMFPAPSALRSRR